MCDPRDLGLAITEDIAGTKSYEPDLFLYDNYPEGGIGLSAPLFKLTRRLLGGVLDLLQRARAKAACPACVGYVDEVGGSRSQGGAFRILSELTKSFATSEPQLHPMT